MHLEVYLTCNKQAVSVVCRHPEVHNATTVAMAMAVVAAMATILRRL